MSAFLVSQEPNDHRAAELSKLLAVHRVRASTVASLEEVAQALPASEGRRSLVFVPGQVDASAVVGFCERTSGRTFVVYVSDAMSADVYKQISKSRSGEWIRWSELPHEIGNLVRLNAASGDRDNGRIVSFMPSAGGVGNTTLAVETAIHLTSSRQRRACVLDLNLQSSAIPAYLDVEPRFDIGEILDDPSRLDQHLVDLLSTKHASGVDIFASPPTSFDYRRLDAGILFSLLDEVSKRYDVVHVDLPPLWFPWMDNLLVGSDHVVVTGTYDVPSVKRLASRILHLERISVPNDQVTAVVNRAESGLFGGGVVRRSDVNSALKGVQVLYVRRNDRAAGEAINAGRAVLQSPGGRGLRKDIRRVAERIRRGESGTAAQGRTGRH